MAYARTIVSVVAPHSGSGKTLFVAHLVRHVQGLGCLKISPAHDWPAGPDVGGEPGEQGFFLEDSHRLSQPGKDTALYLAAGAQLVERLRHRRGALPAGLDAALMRFPPTIPLVVESSSAVRLLSPVAVVLVVRPPIREMKPATKDVLPLATDLLVNAAGRRSQTGGTREESTAEARRLQEQFPSLRPVHIWSADLIREPPPAEMLHRLQTLLHHERPLQED